MAIDMTTVKQIMHNNKEVAKIEDGLGNTLWQKAAPQRYYIKDGNYYINKGSSGSDVINSTTPETAWQIESDNRVSCLDGDTKRYLQWQWDDSSNMHVCKASPTLISTNWGWVYKNGNYITETLNSPTWYLYKHGASGVRMHTTVTTLTFEPVS